MRKSILSVILGLLAGFSLAAQEPVNKIAIAAHRGWWKGNAQNSIESITRAQNAGFWGSEFDVQMTADGVPVVNHDPTAGSVEIRQNPYDALADVRLANGEKVSTLDEYLVQGAKSANTVLVLEIKIQPTVERTIELTDKCVAALKNHGLYEPSRVIFISFSYDACKHLAKIAPDFTNQYLNGDKTPAEVHADGINGIDYHRKKFKEHPEWVNEAHALGMSVNVWTVNDAEEMQYMIDLGVDCITTNEPDVARSLLRERENTLGFTVPEMVEIPEGTFVMGSKGSGYDYDESPAHKVTISAFRMSACEITNAQFEEFMPSHKAFRGSEWNISTGDNEAVAYVSWYDAVAYCKWLSERTGRLFSLPTEAQWEYACRAGTVTPYYSGKTLPDGCCRNQKTERNLKTVSLEVGVSQPNAWGLYDMHGNVEEWCSDFYGPYSAASAVNPTGPAGGDFRVTRGGSHNTPAEFLRSANRSASFPEDFHSQIGFRIVEALPLFAEPVPYVLEPKDGTPFYKHNHQPAVTWCDNGDLLAIWFSCDAESGREMVVLQSRFHAGSWSPAELFFKVPDRNMTGSSLIRLPDGRIMHVNGVGNSGDWQNLALAVRYSSDDGLSWSDCRQVSSHGKRHQVIAGGIVLRDGTIVQPCDAGPEGHDGTAVQISTDCGQTWSDPWDGTWASNIGGIHAGLVELKDGSWLALGRGNSVKAADGKLYMPKSISKDRGKSWTVTASCFPPIDSGQRLVLRRLNEGPLMLVSFGENGLFVSLSYDDGKTWPVRKLMTDGKRRVLNGGAWTKDFVMDEGHSEPKGYMAATQTPDGTIHILSSRLHYQINLPWIESK